MTTNRNSWNLFSMLVVGLLASGCVSPRTKLNSKLAHEFRFERYEIQLGPEEHSAVLTGFLLGGAIADLAVLNIGKHDERTLRIYSFESTNWKPKLKSTLRAGVSFVDVAKIGGRDRLLTYEPGRVSWFDPASETERELVSFRSGLEPLSSHQILHVDLTRDVNGDDREDLVVPDVQGFQVFVQKENGAFADPVRIGTAAGKDLIQGAAGYRYHPWLEGGRVHTLDHNQDGRDDLVYWNQDHFEVHPQNEEGLFAAKSESFTTEVTFDSDDLASLVAPQGVRQRRTDHAAPGKMSGRVLHSLRDMNGDGVADLVIFSLNAGSSRLLGQMSELWSMHSAYEVHFGRPVPGGGIVFSREISTAIDSDGIPFELEPHDFEQNGQVDVMISVIDPGVFKAMSMILSAVVTGSVSMDLEFYRMESGLYPKKPTATRKAKTNVRGSGEKAGFPSVLIGDVNGDRRMDLLVQNGRKELRLFLGVSKPGLFARKPQKVAVTIPHEEYVWLADLNKDGRQDLLLHHKPANHPGRVTILLASKGSQEQEPGSPAEW